MTLVTQLTLSKGRSAINTVDLIFPRLLKYMSEPDVPYQYMQTIIGLDDIQNIADYLWLICIWATDNLEHKWYICASATDFNVWDEKISFEFNFADSADHMAFKLMWC